MMASSGGQSAFANVVAQYGAWRRSLDHDPLLGQIMDEQSRWCMEYFARMHLGVFMDPFASQVTQKKVIELPSNAPPKRASPVDDVNP